MVETKVTKSRERSDCVVRAISSATGFSYDWAYTFCLKELRRKPNCGVRKNFLRMGIGRLNNFGLTVTPKIGLMSIKPGSGDKPGSMTVNKVLKTYPAGTYLAVSRNHMFVIKDGAIIGNKSDGTRLRVQVRDLWKIEKKC
jgi:hypothetical protein